jgi:glycosyltransferase involved in cell wall biosynthesis
LTTRYGFLSTYPPTLCGLATFTSSLRAELVPAGGFGPVVRAVEGGEQPGRGEIAADLVAGDRSSVYRAASVLNDCDVAIVQHEYGVYGGSDGDELLTLFAALTVPTVVVLHTVLSRPTPHQRTVLERVTGFADAVVTMSSTARKRLVDGYTVDMSKVTVIPHGAPVSRISHAPTFRAGRPLVLSWGLLGPGKGIEWGIEAMSQLSDLGPMPRYLVAGQTHPKVLRRDGESYRDGLQKRVTELGLATTVSFDGHYRRPEALADLVASADVVLLPYDSTDQVTSGVLVEAVAAGRPVIATRFPHAVELLQDGRGILVPHQDPTAIAAALRALLGRQTAAATKARGSSPAPLAELWPAVAEHYRELADQLIGLRVAV